MVLRISGALLSAPHAGDAERWVAPGVALPYEISFRKRLDFPDPGIYINDCCWGGDGVVERLLPAARSAYEDVRSSHEDWGWFIWFRRGVVRLAMDVFCDVPEEGLFRVHLTARRKKWLFLDSIVDDP
jgi:hypothetical protein